MFNKELFKMIIEKARGNRTNEDYSKDSGISRAYISKLINMRTENPPSPEIIKRLANASYNNVTYDELMVAAGYINFSDNSDTVVLEGNQIPKQLQNVGIKYLEVVKDAVESGLTVDELKTLIELGLKFKRLQ